MSHQLGTPWLGRARTQPWDHEITSFGKCDDKITQGNEYINSLSKSDIFYGLSLRLFTKWPNLTYYFAKCSMGRPMYWEQNSEGATIFWLTLRCYLKTNAGWQFWLTFNLTYHTKLQILAKWSKFITKFLHKWKVETCFFII